MSTEELRIEKPSAVVLAAGRGVPQRHELSAMRDQLRSGHLPLSTRWELGRQFNQALKVWFQDQIDKSLAVAQAGTHAAANAKLKEIAQYLNQYTLELRGRYIATMRDLGMRVEKDQMEFAYSAAVALSAELERVATAKITPKFKEQLVEMINSRFDRLMQGLNTLTDDLYRSATQIEAQ